MQVSWDKEFELVKNGSAWLDGVRVTFLGIRISPMQRLPNGIEIFPKAFYQFRLERGNTSEDVELNNDDNKLERGGFSLLLAGTDDNSESVKLIFST